MRKLLFIGTGLFMFSVAAIAQPFGQVVGPGPVPCAYTTCTITTLVVSGTSNLGGTTVSASGGLLLNNTADFNNNATSRVLNIRFGASSDTIIGANGAANLRFGNPDADTTAAMVAQTVSSQGALAGGTSNQAGVNWTFIASPGKGTGAGGSFIFQTAPAGSTGTAVNASVKRLGIDSTGAITMPSLASSSAAQTGTVCWTTATGNLTVDTTTTCLLSLEEFKNIKGGVVPSEALGEVMKLKPIWFSYKPGHASTDLRIHAGLGAHQVASVDPRLAGYDSKGELTGVRYADSITSLNVAAIQELTLEINRLKVEVQLLNHKKHIR